jgi:hypothetical protein
MAQHATAKTLHCKLFDRIYDESGPRSGDNAAKTIIMLQNDPGSADMSNGQYY